MQWQQNWKYMTGCGEKSWTNYGIFLSWNIIQSLERILMKPINLKTFPWSLVLQAKQPAEKYILNHTFCKSNNDRIVHCFNKYHPGWEEMIMRWMEKEDGGKKASRKEKKMKWTTKNTQHTKNTSIYMKLCICEHVMSISNFFKVS